MVGRGFAATSITGTVTTFVCSPTTLAIEHTTFGSLSPAHAACRQQERSIAATTAERGIFAAAAAAVLRNNIIA